MEAALWIAAIALAFVFLPTGVFKLLKGKAGAIKSGQEWANDFTDMQVRGIGLAEVLGSLAVTLPPLFNVAVWIVPFAALGLMIVGFGASVVHLRRGDRVTAITVPALLGVISLIVVVGRFGDFGFDGVA